MFPVILWPPLGTGQLCCRSDDEPFASVKLGAGSGSEKGSMFGYTLEPSANLPPCLPPL